MGTAKLAAYGRTPNPIDDGSTTLKPRLRKQFLATFQKYREFGIKLTHLSLENREIIKPTIY